MKPYPPGTRGYQGLQSLAGMGKRFGLDSTKKVHNTLLKSLRDWWDHGIKKGDRVWVADFGELFQAEVVWISPPRQKERLASSCRGSYT